MNHIFLILLVLIVQATAFSQDTPIKKNIGDEPYPAPVMYDNVTLDEAKLIGLFENQEVGNMHVYSHLKQEDRYFYNGTPITPTFSKFFNDEIAYQTNVSGKEPRAVFSIRGEAEELYLIRFVGNDWDNELALFGWNNGKLEKRITIAKYSCENDSCLQIDSWLQDINGDTRLDIVQKAKKATKKGKGKSNTTVYLMDQNGVFRKTKYDHIELNDYRMENLW